MKKMSASNTYVSRRVACLREALRKRGVQGLLVTAVEDVGYLSGFSGDDSWLVASGVRPCLLTDFRYEEQADRECPEIERVIRRGQMIEALAKVVRRRKIARLGFDPDAVSVGLMERLHKGLKGVRLEPVKGVVTGMRIRKDASEIAAIRKAVAVAAEGWAEFRKHVRLGMTERHLAAEIDHQMRLAGADALAFPTIVGINATAAMPHAHPGDKRLKTGDVLLVDFGARVGGYVCDLTRVLVAGRIPPRVRKVYDLVHRAQAAGIAAVRPGAAFTEVDAAARNVIADAGHGEVFRHGLGHGIGRLVHEAPALGPTAPQGCLEPGMVITIEPGVYLRGRFGIRIEDDVLVTPTGHEVLTRVEKDLEAMVL